MKLYANSYSFSNCRYIAESFDIPILVTNQITTKVSCDQEEGGGVVTVALGNSWSHSVNTRLIMQYREGNKRLVCILRIYVRTLTLPGTTGFVYIHVYDCMYSSYS